MHKSALFTATVRRCGEDLRQFSDDQVAQGLDLLFDPSFSDLSFSLKAASGPRSALLEAVQSIYTLYAHCFERRCAPLLSSSDERGGDPLDAVCWMLWDEARSIVGTMIRKRPSTMRQS